MAVDDGLHSVGELGAGGTNLSNFSSSISCVDSSGNPVKSGSGTSLTGVNVPTGDSVVCTITNTLLQSHLTLVKQVTNDNGGTALATDWTLNANGPTPITGTSGSASVTNATVNAGSYALTETNGPSGYTPSAWVCVGGTQNGSNISLTGSGRDLHDHQRRQRAEADAEQGRRERQRWHRGGVGVDADCERTAPTRRR